MVLSVYTWSDIYTGDASSTSHALHYNTIIYKYGKMFNALKSLYGNVKCTVRLNGVHSDWFKVQTGLKQGCILSLLLLNAFVNDLIEEIRRLHFGIPYTDNELIFYTIIRK